MKKETRKKQAENVLKKWKNFLGFGSWKFKVKVIKFQREDGFLQDGDIKVNYLKKQASIVIGNQLKASAEEIVVHELVHLMLWKFDRKMALIIKSLHKLGQEKAMDEYLGKLEKIVKMITMVFIKKRKS